MDGNDWAQALERLGQRRGEAAERLDERGGEREQRVAHRLRRSAHRAIVRALIARESQRAGRDADPAPRLALVAHVRQKLAQGAYDNAHALDATVSAMLRQNPRLNPLPRHTRAELLAMRERASLTGDLDHLAEIDGALMTEHYL